MPVKVSCGSAWASATRRSPVTTSTSVPRQRGRHVVAELGLRGPPVGLDRDDASTWPGSASRRLGRSRSNSVTDGPAGLSAVPNRAMPTSVASVDPAPVWKVTASPSGSRSRRPSACRGPPRPGPSGARPSSSSNGLRRRPRSQLVPMVGGRSWGCRTGSPSGRSAGRSPGRSASAAATPARSATRSTSGGVDPGPLDAAARTRRRARTGPSPRTATSVPASSPANRSSKVRVDGVGEGDDAGHEPHADGHREERQHVAPEVGPQVAQRQLEHARHQAQARSRLLDPVEHRVRAGAGASRRRCARRPGTARGGRRRRPPGSWVTMTIVWRRSSTAGPHEREDLGAAAAVEVAGGLVREDDRRPADERPGHGHPLLLAAGQLGRPVAEAGARPTVSTT